MRINNFIRTGILLLIILCFCPQGKSQNMILLKDRYNGVDHSGAVRGPSPCQLIQARIFGNSIYTVEFWEEETQYAFQQKEGFYIGKYDLYGNLIVRKYMPEIIQFNSYATWGITAVRPLHTNGIAEISIFKDNQNNIIYHYAIGTESAPNTYYLYKVSSNLDSLKLLPIIHNNVDYRELKERQCIQTTDGNLLILTYKSSCNTNICKTYELKKIDYNLNTVWTREIKLDSNTAGLYSFLNKSRFSNLQKYCSFNEINNKYYIGIGLFDQHCDFHLIQDDSVCTSNNLIAIFSFNEDGNQIKTDTFTFDNNYAEMYGEDQHKLYFNLYQQNNGYRITSYYYQYGGNDSLRIFDLDTLTNKATLISSKYQAIIGGATSNFIFKNGFIKFNDHNDTLTFYNFNTNHTNAMLNQQSAKPVPDSFYVYYGGRFQKAIFYNTDWIDENIDTNYLLLGRITLADSGTFMTIIPLSDVYGAYLGKVYKDNNKSCTFDTIIDKPYANRTIEVTKTSSQVPYKYYDFTDANGKFEIYTDTGQFSAKVFPTSNLWTACPTTQSFALNAANDTVTQNFFLQRLVSCPKLSVSISTGRLRPCTQSTYYVNYCNRGTADAVGATVVVDFDSLLIVNSASVPYTNIGNKYTFQIGNIAEDACGQFTVNTTLNCATTLGTTQCVTAHIYPDSLCAPIDPRWDRANVSVDGRCIGDSVLFRIRNIGSGNMSQIKKYIVIEDNVLRIQPINFQLNAGQEIILKRPANGTTQRLYAEQVDYFPYPSNPTAVVEGCGGLSTGFVNQFPNNDGADFIAVNCTQNIGSFDPNDKEGTPTGYDNQHYIAKRTDINYKVRFQNTGTDTAYDIYILDTLSKKLNVASLQMGAASHPYTYEIYGDGYAVLKVVFRNINLVDSFHNELLSHGFFTYSIAQDTLNQTGDQIKNDAFIYFDSNHPVKTNTTLHTVSDSYFRVISSVINNKTNVVTNAYPNPFNDKCTIEIKTDKQQHLTYQFKLFNLNGELIQTQTVTDRVELFAKDLPAAIYLYRIEQNGELIGAGKIVKE